MKQDMIDRAIERNKATIEHLKTLRKCHPNRSPKPGQGNFHFHNRKARSMTSQLRAQWKDLETGHGSRELFESRVELLREHCRLGGCDFEGSMEFVRHEITFRQVILENQKAAAEKKRQAIRRQKKKFRNRHKRRTR